MVLPPHIEDVPPPGLAIVEELDKLMLVQLRDGRKIVGTLRSFDQFANLVLEGGWGRGGAGRAGVGCRRGQAAFLLCASCSARRRRCRTLPGWWDWMSQGCTVL